VWEKAEAERKSDREQWRAEIEEIFARMDRKSSPEMMTTTQCGMAPKGRNIERSLLINGYVSNSGFIGNDRKFTQQPSPKYQRFIS
jgi:hypothetical protein